MGGMTFFFVFIENENLLNTFQTLNPSEGHIRGNLEGPANRWALRLGLKLFRETPPNPT